jgi:hypothetical protein
MRVDDVGAIFGCSCLVLVQNGFDDVAGNICLALRRGKKAKTGDGGEEEAEVVAPVWFPGLAALSPTDRRVVEVTAGGLRRRFAALIGEFHALRLRIRDDYKQTVARRYYAVTGQEAGAYTRPLLSST